MSKERKFIYWPKTPTPICQQPRWAIGRLGPRIIVQCSEADAKLLTELLNERDKVSPVPAPPS